MESCVRVIECGGQGPRVVDISENHKIIGGFDKRNWEEDISWLNSFGLPNGTKAIIYSVAGVVEDHAKVIKCPNVSILNGRVLGDKSGSPPSFVCNDMEAAITGMAHLYPNLDYFMGITRSTGIGARIWKNGEILSDSEAGHMQIDGSPFAPLCGCGKRGCAEAILAGNAITKFVVGEMHLQNRKIPEDVHPCEWLDRCDSACEEWAMRHYNEVLIPGMATFLANIQMLLHLPAIVWKGTLGLRSFRDVLDLEAAIRQEMKERIINPAWVDDLKFYMMDCPKDHEAYIGAAKIALNLIKQN